MCGILTLTHAMVSIVVTSNFKVFAVEKCRRVNSKNSIQFQHIPPNRMACLNIYLSELMFQTQQFNSMHSN